MTRLTHILLRDHLTGTELGSSLNVLHVPRVGEFVELPLRGMYKVERVTWEYCLPDLGGDTLQSAVIDLS